ncbi:MAG: hypothetical protein DWC11_02700 [Candidatus Poseidoniales archaeon]|nr:MAG: hypothetical protein DWC11_02700 [Candidatus Poseidoniales archaeon]
MRRALLGALLVLSFSLAGCLAPSSAGWGEGGVKVVGDGMNVTVVSDLNTAQVSVPDVKLAGCDTDGMIGVASNQPRLITIEGHLAASTLYNAHGEDLRGLSNGVTASVILEAMTYENAETVPNGQGARVPVKNWAEPLYPETGSGQSTSQRTVNVQDVDRDSNEAWFVLGLIPASEHVAYGLGAVNEVHQPIRIEGYLVDSADGKSLSVGGTSGADSIPNQPCTLDVDDSNKGTHFVIVHSITLLGASVTMDGEADDEWVMGDVPMLGRGGYLVYFLVVAVGGGFGLFVVSSAQVKGAAASQAKVLLGQENMAKAETARKAPKRKEPEPKREAPEPKKEKKAKKKEESSIGGFDLDAALSTKGSSSSKPERSSRGGSSVVVTDEASKMASQSTVSSQSSTESSPPWEPPVSTPQRKSGGVTPMSGGPPRSAPPTRSEPQGEKPKVRRRRAVRSAAPAPEPAPEPEPEPEPAAAPPEEEEFTDFSF